MDKIAADEPSPLSPLPPPFCLSILKKYNNNNNNNNSNNNNNNNNRNKSAKTFYEQSKRMWGWNPQKSMKLEENDNTFTPSLHLVQFCHVSFLLYTAARNPSFLRYLLLNIASLFSDIHVLHTLNACCRNSVKSNWVKRGLKSKYG